MGFIQKLLLFFYAHGLKKWPNSSYITTCCLGEFQEIFSQIIQKQLQHIQLSDTTGISNGTSFHGKIKKYIFLAANIQDGFGELRDKKYPMRTIKYTAVFLMLWAYIS